MRRDWVGTIRRGLRKPPRHIAERLAHEVQGQAERFLAPRRPARVSAAFTACEAGGASVSERWAALVVRPYVAGVELTLHDVVELCPGAHEAIMAAAQRALERRVDLLGSGPVELGRDIDWHKDYKTGHRWAPAFHRDIDYNNPERPSDVKFPWELSRMQWAIPLGQAYVLTRDERYARSARQLLEHWIANNPYAGSVNWSCTMEVALRILSWTWFFHVFHGSEAWRDAGFRERFLKALYLHGDFTARNLEKSDVNGNHYTADAAGLVFAGLFFGRGVAPQRWLELGWTILCDELPRQVFRDGVDFEASVPYHRLVLELFLLPALYRRRHGLSVPDAYRARLVAMAEFTAAYSRPNGSVPLWGDADDARALPFGNQALNDHRYLVGIVGLVLDVPALVESSAGARAEALWLMGPDAARRLPERSESLVEPRSVAFREGGFYVLRTQRDHVFVDCGPIGLAGRGGHGHNDLLSFEAVLDGEHLVTDSGAYLYTADYHERNLFRSTDYHNTPRIDGEEINRFERWDYLWTLHQDARHQLIAWEPGTDMDVLCMGHDGYARLEDPVSVKRVVLLDRELNALTVCDRLEGRGEHTVSIPMHMTPEVSVSARSDSWVELVRNERRFRCVWSSLEPWTFAVESSRVSPSYGRASSSERLRWRARWSGSVELRVSMFPARVDSERVQGRADEALRTRADKLWHSR